MLLLKIILLYSFFPGFHYSIHNGSLFFSIYYKYTCVRSAVKINNYHKTTLVNLFFIFFHLQYNHWPFFLGPTSQGPELCAFPHWLLCSAKAVQTYPTGVLWKLNDLYIYTTTKPNTGKQTPFSFFLQQVPSLG